MTAEPLTPARRRSIEVWVRRDPNARPSRALADLLAEIDRLKTPRRAASPRNCPLTDRQLSVLVAVANGASRAEAGRWLGISENSVKGHLRTVFHVLRVASAAQAVAMAVTYGWITDEDLQLPDIADLSPAPLVKERQEYYDRAAALRARPGRWEVVATYSTPGSAKQSAYRLRVGAFKAFRPASYYEAEAFTEDGTHHVRARYIGAPALGAESARS